MEISETYSHLNGLEYLLVQKKELWDELKEVISLVDGKKCKTKISREQTMLGKQLYNLVRQGRGAPAVPIILIGVEI